MGDSDGRSRMQPYHDGVAGQAHGAGIPLPDGTQPSGGNGGSCTPNITAIFR
jgi:hypothetical protein